MEVAGVGGKFHIYSMRCIFIYMCFSYFLGAFCHVSLCILFSQLFTLSSSV